MTCDDGWRLLPWESYWKGIDRRPRDPQVLMSGVECWGNEKKAREDTGVTCPEHDWDAYHGMNYGGLYELDLRGTEERHK